MLAAAAAVIAGCGDTASSSPAPATKKAADTSTKSAPKTEKKKPPTDTEQLETLLLDRGAALAQGDVEDFLATSTGAQARKDKRQIAAAKALPLTSVELKAAGHGGLGRQGDDARRDVLLASTASTPTTSRRRG